MFYSKEDWFNRKLDAQIESKKKELEERRTHSRKHNVRATETVLNIFRRKSEALDLTADWFSKLASEKGVFEEWDPLLETIMSDDFDLYRKSGTGDIYLIGQKRRTRKKRLVFNARYLDGFMSSSRPLPSFIPLILDLKVVPAGDPEKMIRYQGGIAGYGAQKTAQDFWMRDPRRFNRMIGYEDMFEQPEIPENLYVFQAGISGRMFFLDEKSRIRVFSRMHNRFKVVGSLDNFIRFCLYFLIDGWDWYDDGYGREYNLEYFDLKHYP